MYRVESLCFRFSGCSQSLMPNKKLVNAMWPILMQWGLLKSNQLASDQANQLHKYCGYLMLTDCPGMRLFTLSFHPFASEKAGIFWLYTITTTITVLHLLHRPFAPMHPIPLLCLHLICAPLLLLPWASWCLSQSHSPQCHLTEPRTLCVRCYFASSDGCG